MCAAHFTGAEQGQVSITAGTRSNLCSEQRLACASLGGNDNQLTLSESPGPLVELVNVREYLQPRSLSSDGQGLRCRLKVGRPIVFRAFQVAGEAGKLFNSGIEQCLDTAGLL